MLLTTEVKEIPAQTVASASGLILSIPCEEFIDPAHPDETVSSALRRGHVFCEYGAPLIAACQSHGEVMVAINRIRSIELSRVCGYVSNVCYGVVDGYFQLRGEFTPHGPLKAQAIELMRVGVITISPRIQLNADGKIACIPSFDVVAEETPRYQFIRTVK
ncbi:TPA: hypothetical protein ACTPQ1_004523 [Salmonella enterica]